MTNLSRLLLTSASAMAMVLAAPSVTRAADPVDGVNVTYAGTGAGSQPGGSNTTYTGSFDGSGISIYQVGIATGDATDAMVLSGSGTVQDVQGNYSSASGAALRLDGGSGTTAVFSGASSSYVSASGTALSLTGSASSTLTLDDSIVSGATGIVMATPQASITLRNTQLTGGIDLSGVTQHTDLAIDSASSVDAIGGANASLTLTLGAGAHGETGALNLSNVTGSGFISFSQQGSIWQYSGTITTSNSLVELSGGARAILANAGALGHTAINFLNGTVEFTQTGTYANNIIVPGTAALQADTGVVATLTGVIAEPGSLNFTGPGTFDLTTMGTTSTWNGVTTLNGGVTVKVNAVNQLGGTQVNLGDAGSGATLQLDGGLDYTRALTLGTGGTNIITGYGTLSGLMTGSGGVTFGGNGSLIFIPVGRYNDYTGPTTIGAGTTVVIQASEGFGTNRSVTLDGGTLEATVLDKDIVLTADSTINHVGNSDAHYYGSITGNHDLRFIRTGQFYNAYVDSAVSLGSLTIDDGVQFSASGTTSVTGLLTLNGSASFYDNGMPTGLQVGGLAGSGSLYLNKTLVITNANAGDVFSGSLGLNDADAGLTIAGGTLTVTNFQPYYTGVTEIDSGATLALQSFSTFGTSSQFLIKSGGTFDARDVQSYVANLAGAGQVLLGSSGYFEIGSAASDFSGVISGGPNASLNIDAGGNQTLSGVNTFTGQAYVAGGATLTLAGAGSLGGQVYADTGATLDVTGVTTGGSIGGLWGYGTVNLGDKTLTLTNAVDDANVAYGFAGAFNGTGNVTLTGGTQILSGDSTATFSGTTTVAGGTLIVANAGALGSGGVRDPSTFITAPGGLVLAGGTLDLRADFNNAITVTADSVIDNTDAYHQLMGGLNGDHLLKVTGNQDIGLFFGNGTFSGTIENASGASMGLNGFTNATLLADAGTTTYLYGEIGNLAGSGNVVLSPLNGTVTLTAPSGSFAGSLSGNAFLRVAPGATFNLAGSYSAYDIYLTNSRLNLVGSGDVAAGGALQMNGGTFDISGATGNRSVYYITSASANDSILLGANTLTSTYISDIAGVISGTGGVNISDPGVGNRMFPTIFRNANTYTGATTIADNATLALVGNGSLAGKVDTSTTGILDVSGATDIASIGGLSGAGTVTLGSKTLAVTNASNADLFSGNISGAGNLSLAGGTLKLTGANGLTGNVLVGTGATLMLTGGGSVADAASVQLTGTGIFDISGTTSGASITTLASPDAYQAVLLGSKTLTITAGATDFGGSLSGSGGVIIAGGTQTFSGVSANVGNTTIADGATLKLAGTASGLLSMVNTSSAGTLDISGTATSSTVNTVTGSGSLILGSKTLRILAGSGNFSGTITGGSASEMDVVYGAWTLQHDNSATYSGTTLVSTYGTLTVTNAGALGTGGLTLSGGTLGLVADLSNPITVTANSVIDNTDATHTLSGAIAGDHTLKFTGNQTIALTGGASGSSFSGILENASTADLQIQGSFANATLQLDAGSSATVGSTLLLSGLTGSGTLNLTGGDLRLDGGNSTFDGDIAGNHWLYVSDGSLTLTHAITMNDLVDVYDGTLALSGAGTISSLGRLTLHGGGTFDISGMSASGITIGQVFSGSSDDRIVLGSKTLTLSANSNIDGVISGTGGLALSNTSGTTTLSNANTYTGTTTIANGAQLNLTGSGSLAGKVDTSSAGTLDVSGVTTATAIGGLDGSGTLNLGAKDLTVSISGISVFSGAITGSGSITLTGGNERLGGGNAAGFSGTVTASGGYLTLMDAGALGSGSLILAGGHVDLVSDIGNPILVTADSTIQNSNVTHTLSGDFSGDHTVTIAGSNTIVFDGTSTFTGVLENTASANFQLQTGLADATVQTESGATTEIVNSLSLKSITGSGTVLLDTGKTLTLTGASSFNGVTTIGDAATLALTGSGNVAGLADTSTTGSLDISGATGATSIASLTGTGAVILGANTLTLTNAGDSFGGTITGTGGLTITGGNQTFTHQLDYTGLTSLNGGQLTLQNGGALAAGNSVGLTGGTFYDRPTTAQTLATVSGDGASGVTIDGGGGGSLSVGTYYQAPGGNLYLTNGAQLTVGTMSGSAAATLVSGTTLTVGDANDQETTFALQGSGGTFIKAGTGTLSFVGGAFGFTGNFTVSAGTLKAISSSSLYNPSQLTVSSGATLDLAYQTARTAQLLGSGTITDSSTVNFNNPGGVVSVSQSQTINAAFTGAAGLAVTNSSAVTLATAPHGNGQLSVDAGSHLIVGGDAAVGFLSGGGDIDMGTHALSVGGNFNGASFGGTLSGSGAFTLANGARQAMTGVNSYTGVTTIADGATLMLSGSGDISASSLVDVQDGGTLDIGGVSAGTTVNDLAGDGTRSRVVLGANTLTIANANSTFAGVISGTGGVTIASGITAFTGANTYTGATTISDGTTLELANGGSVAGLVDTSSTGTLNITGSTPGSAVGGLSGAGSVSLGNSLELTNASTTFSGTISGAGGLTLDAGNQTLSSANSYGGGTTIAGGTLTIGDGGALGSGGVTLSGGTLGLAVNFTNAITVTADSAIALPSGAAHPVFSGGISGDHMLTFSGPQFATATLAAGGNFSGTISNQITTFMFGSSTMILESSFANATLDTGSDSVSEIAADLSLKTLSGSGRVQMDHNLTLTDASGTFAGSTRGTGDLTIAAGSLTVTSGLGHQGVTEIDSGATLVLDGGGAVGRIDIQDGALLSVSSATGGAGGLSGGTGARVTLDGDLVMYSVSGTFDGVISGAGGLVINGGTQTLSGANTFSGRTDVFYGTLALAGSASLAGRLSLSTSNSVLDVSGATAASVDSLFGAGTVITGTSGVLAVRNTGGFIGVFQGSGTVKQDTGLMNLGGDSTGFTGTFEMEDGASLMMSSSGLITDAHVVLKGSAAMDISGAYADRQVVSLAGEANSTVALGAYRLTLSNANDTFAGVIGGTGGLTIASGTETLSGVNSYTGATIVGGGATLALTGSGAIAASGGVGLQSGTLDISATDAGAAVQGLFFSGGTVMLGSKTLTINITDDEEYLGLITGTGGLIVNGDANGTQEFTVQLDYTGGTTLNSSGIDLHDGGAFAAGSDLVLNGGLFLDVPTTAQTLGTVSGNGAAYIVLDGSDGGSLSVANWTQTGGNLTLSNGMQLTIGALSGSTAMNLTAGTGLIAGDTSDTVFSGNIQGSGSLTKQGSGTLTLAGQNNFSGAVAVSAGTLKLNAAAAPMVLNSLDVASGATLDLAGTSIYPVQLTGTGTVTSSVAVQDVIAGGNAVMIDSSQTIDASFAGAAGLVVTGNSNVVLTAASAFTGKLVIDTGSTVALDANASVTGAVALISGTLDMSGIAASGDTLGRLSGTGTVEATGKVLSVSGGTGTFSGTLNAAALTITGGAVQTLTSAPNLSGPVTIDANSYLALGGAADLTGLAVTDNGTLDITGITASSTSIASLSGSGNVYLADKTLVITAGNGTFSGDIYGTTGIVDISGTNQVLAGNNFYGGTTLLRPGTILIVGSTTAFGTSVLDFQQGAGLKFGALSGTFANKAVLEGDAIFRLAGGTVTYAGAVTGTGTLTVLGTGGTVVLTNAANDYGGTLVQGNSTVRVDVAGALGKGAVTLGADGFRGTLQAGGSMVLTNAVTVEAGSGTIDTQANTLTIAGNIGGSGALTKTGSGTLVLTGTDSAATTIAAGTLRVGSGGSIGDVADNAALAFDTGLTYAGTISGSGSLTIASGTTILTGSAAQTGGTTIAGGASLQIGNGGSVAGAITDNGTLAFDSNAILNNAVSGSGNIAVTSGTLQLGTGSIATSNSVAISSGAVFDLNGRSQTIGALSGSGAVALGSGALTLNSGSFGGAIGGSGTVTTGGDVTLSGTNTYTGATRVAAGVLTVSGSIANSSGVTVASGAALAAGGTVSNVTIQSGGTLAPVAGSVGMLAVSGDLTLAGGSSTIVDVTAAAADRITVSGAASIAGALKVNYLGSGFDVGQYTLISSTGTLSGTFDSLNLSSDLGNLATTLVYDVHDVYLKLANTFVAGQTFSLDSGTANVNGDQTVGGLSGTGGTINTSGGTLTVEQKTDTTFFGTITGTGPITKTGSGTLILDGNNSGFTGPTTVNGGLFEIGDANHPNAVYGGSVTVGAGGTLGGHGTIAGSVVNSGGTAPGGSIGTLTVLGNYGFASGANLQQEVAANGSADLLKVGGTVTIAGNTTVLVQPTDPVASYARVTNYIIVTGQGGVSGSLTSASSSAASLTPILSYGPNAVNLTLVRNDISLATLAKTANQAAVGGAISARPGSALFAAVAPLADAQLPAVFDSLSGEVHATLAGALLNDGRVLDDAIRVRGAAGEGTHVWGNGDYRGGSFDGSASAAAAGTHLTSFALGADTQLAEGLRVGAAASVTRNTLSIAARVSRGAVNSLYIGGYGGFETGAYAFDMAVTHGWNNIGTSRVATGQTETADYNAGTTTASGEARYRADLGSNLLAEPFARLTAVWLSTDSFTETGGSAALSGAARDHSLLFSDIGARISTQYLLGDTALTPHASLAWEHASGDIAVSQALSFGGGAAFNVTGAPLARDAAAVEAGIGATIGGWTLGLDYTGRAGSGASENGVRLRIGTTF